MDVVRGRGNYRLVSMLIYKNLEISKYEKTVTGSEYLNPVVTPSLNNPQEQYTGAGRTVSGENQAEKSVYNCSYSNNLLKKPHSGAGCVI